MPLPTSRFCVALAAAGLLLAHGLPADSAVRQRLAARAAADTGPGRVIVTYRNSRASALSARVQAQGDTSPVQEAQTLSQRHALDLRDGRTVAPRTQVLISNTLTSEQLRKRLAGDSDVASITVDHRRRAHAAPNDPLYPAGQTQPYPAAGQWYLRPPTAPAVSSIDAESAWNLTAGSSSIVVAVLDTGVRPEHPDLQGKLLPGYDFIKQVANTNDSDGIDGDPSDPGDWVTSADLTSSNRTAYLGCDGPNDSTWHGTQTAALVGAATNNGIGMASVGRHVMVLPVRVLGKCGGFDSDIVAGMRWAAGLAVAGTAINPTPAKVVNLSLGNPPAIDPDTRQPIACTEQNSVYPSVVAELARAGVLVVASAGNDGLLVNTPADCSGVFAVAGLRHAGDKGGYSSLGRAAEIAAPMGNCDNSPSNTLCNYMILSASNAGTEGPTTSIWTDGLDRGFYEGLGTSFSAPLVSATAALMLSANPGLSVDQLRTLLKSSTRSFPASGGVASAACVEPAGTAASDAQINCYCTTTTCGAGMLDTGAAVQAAVAGRPVAHLGGTPPMVTPGATVTLDGSASSAGSGATVRSYLWEVIDGAALATITSANNTSSVTLATLASTTSGRFTVRLTLTDSNNASATATQTFTVGSPTSAVTPVPVTTTTADSGGGGGALDAGWAVLGLLAAGTAWRTQRRTAGRRTRRR
jgi:serine protease